MATLTETAGAPPERFPETARRIPGTTGERRRFGARPSHHTVLVRLDARARRVLAAVLLLAGAAVHHFFRNFNMHHGFSYTAYHPGDGF